MGFRVERNGFEPTQLTNLADNVGEEGEFVSEANVSTFHKLVLEDSKNHPVLVDFWAPWFAPCRELGPILEQSVNEAGGTMRLVRVNIDLNQSIATQLGIQSIPTIVAFVGGRPIDAFTGAISKQEVDQFIQKLLPDTNVIAEYETHIFNALEAAQNAFNAREYSRAAEMYAGVLNEQPNNLDAILGLAYIYFRTGERDKARRALELVPLDRRKDPKVLSLASAMELIEQATDVSETSDFARKLELNPDDLQTRFDYALNFLTQHMKQEAVDQLLEILRRDPHWQEEAAKKKLIELFERWGSMDEVTQSARRQMSSILFS